MAAASLSSRALCKPLGRPSRPAHGGRQPSRLRVTAIAEFVRPTDQRKEAILLKRFAAHTSSTAAALVLRDEGEAGAATLGPGGDGGLQSVDQPGPSRT